MCYLSLSLSLCLLLSDTAAATCGRGGDLRRSEPASLDEPRGMISGEEMATRTRGSKNSVDQVSTVYSKYSVT